MGFKLEKKLTVCHVGQIVDRYLKDAKMNEVCIHCLCTFDACSFPVGIHSKTKQEASLPP